MGGDSITPFLSTQTCSFYEPPLDLGRLPTRRQCVWDVHIAGLRYLHGRLFVHFQFAGAGFYTPVPLRLKNTWVHRGVAHTVWEWLYCEFSCLKGQISHGCDKNTLRESCVTDLHERLSESFSPDLLSDLGQWRSSLTTIHQITRLFKLTVFASIARMPTRSTSFIAATMCFFKGAHTHTAKTKACILF